MTQTLRISLITHLLQGSKGADSGSHGTVGSNSLQVRNCKVQTKVARPFNSPASGFVSW
jgi:hypothetical protein